MQGEFDGRVTRVTVYEVHRQSTIWSFLDAELQTLALSKCDLIMHYCSKFDLMSSTKPMLEWSLWRSREHWIVHVQEH